jgi:hypothetical protein
VNLPSPETSLIASACSHIDVFEEPLSFGKRSKELSIDLDQVLQNFSFSREHSIDSSAEVMQFAVDGTVVRAHRSIVAVRCPSLLELAPNADGFIKIEQCSALQFQSLLRWIYTAQVDTFTGSESTIDLSALMNLLLLANRFSLAPLADYCLTVIQQYRSALLSSIAQEQLTPFLRMATSMLSQQTPPNDAIVDSNTIVPKVDAIRSCSRFLFWLALEQGMLCVCVCVCGYSLFLFIYHINNRSPFSLLSPTKKKALLYLLTPRSKLSFNFSTIYLCRTLW